MTVSEVHITVPSIMNKECGFISRRERTGHSEPVRV